MNKRNAIVRTLVASAVLAVMGVAQAGSLSITKRTVANEAFGSAFSATTGVFVPNVAYVFNTPGGIVVNPGGSVQVKYVMTGGTWVASNTLDASNVVITNMPSGLTAAAPVISQGGVVAATGDTLTATVTNPTAANITIGIGGTVNLVGSNVNRIQAQGVTVGTVVAVTGGAFNGVNVLEATTAATTVIDYAQAVTLAFVASTETKKIDLSSTPAGSSLTAGVAAASKVQIGRIRATNAGTAPNSLDAAVAAPAAPAVIGVITETPIVVGSSNAYAAGYTVTVGVASGAFVAKQGLLLSSTADCSGALGAGVSTQLPTSANTTSATTSVVVSSSGTIVPNAADLLAGPYVCSDYTNVTAGTVLTALTPTIASTYTRSSTSFTGNTLAATNGYALSTNGQTVDVRTYIPAGTAGYTSYIRVINTGTIAAAVSGQYVYQDGTLGTSGTLVASLPSAGSTTLSSTQVEAALGAPVVTAGARPRVRITAPASGMNVQSFILNGASGAFTEVSGAQ